MKYFSLLNQICYILELTVFFLLFFILTLDAKVRIIPFSFIKLVADRISWKNDDYYYTVCILIHADFS